LEAGVLTFHLALLHLLTRCLLQAVELEQEMVEVQVPLVAQVAEEQEWDTAQLRQAHHLQQLLQYKVTLEDQQVLHLQQVLAVAEQADQGQTHQAQLAGQVALGH
jgi:hypothetical protein